jgi:hypothetical protein
MPETLETRCCPAAMAYLVSKLDIENNALVDIQA